MVHRECCGDELAGRYGIGSQQLDGLLDVLPQVHQAPEHPDLLVLHEVPEHHGGTGRDADHHDRAALLHQLHRLRYGALTGRIVEDEIRRASTRRWRRVSLPPRGDAGIARVTRRLLGSKPRVVQQRCAVVRPERGRRPTVHGRRPTPGRESKTPSCRYFWIVRGDRPRARASSAVLTNLGSTIRATVGVLTGGYSGMCGLQTLLRCMRTLRHADPRGDVDGRATRRPTSDRRCGRRARGVPDDRGPEPGHWAKNPGCSEPPRSPVPLSCLVVGPQGIDP